MSMALSDSITLETMSISPICSNSGILIPLAVFIHILNTRRLDILDEVGKGMIYGGQNQMMYVQV